MKNELPKQIICIGLGWCLGLAIQTIAEDWNQPTVTSNYSSILSDLKARDVSSAKLDYSSATNLPSGVIRWSDTSGKFERWNGSAWLDLQTALTAHLASTSNPHSVTAAQVGAATTSALSAHTSNTSNPHSVTATQLGALRASNNLSDLASASTARSNLGVPASSSVLLKSSNLSDVTDAVTARGNLDAAESGANSDITTLYAVTQMGASYGTFVSGGLGDVSVGPTNSTYRWKFLSNGKVLPPYQPDYTVWPSGLGGYTTVRSINPSAATAADCANIINTMIADGLAQGSYK